MKLVKKFIVDKLNTESKAEQSLINVGIASAISGYSRIIINKFKNIEDNECYYSDTDSVLLKNPLPDSLFLKKLV